MKSRTTMKAGLTIAVAGFFAASAALPAFAQLSRSRAAVIAPYSAVQNYRASDEATSAYARAPSERRQRPSASNAASEQCWIPEEAYDTRGYRIRGSCSQPGAVHVR
jgi:hypothetical protein